MAAEPEPSTSSAKSSNQAPGSSVVDAGTRHIGPTLESEGILADVLGTELPISELSSAQTELQQEDIDALDMRTFAAGPDSTASGSDLSGDQPEELKTRLPGDTSSDPHTDVGPENATTAHGPREA